MSVIGDLGNTAWRAYVTDGVPSSGANKPSKTDILAFTAAVGTALDRSYDAATIFARYNLALWGDSLTYGIGGELGDPATYIPYPSQMDQYLGYRNIYNGGVSGETSTQIATRMLAATDKVKWTTVIWAGRNDIAAIGTGWGTTVKAQIASMVAALTAAGNSNYIILGVTNSGGEYTAAGGTPATNYAAIVALNAELATLYGSRFFDIRGWLVSSALTAIGLTPDSNDLIDIGRDVPPRQLRRDSANVHYNDLGNQAIAYKVAALVAALDAATEYDVTFNKLMGGHGGTNGVPVGIYFNARDSYYLGDTSQGGGRFMTARPVTRSMFIGHGTGPSDSDVTATSVDRTHVGYTAGNESAARGNTSFGSKVLAALTTGTFNTGGGANALLVLTTGSSNTAWGYDTLAAMVSGDNNVAIGRYALAQSTSANPSTGVGYQAGYSLTSGQITAVGFQALRNATTGNGNSAFGEQAGYTLTDGGNNALFGKFAGYTGTSMANAAAFGMRALYAATGDGNIGIGYQAGDNITTGAKNLVVGYLIDAPSATNDGQLTIGNLIFGTALDGTGTTASTGNVGIGGMPDGAGGSSAKLDVYGDKIRLRTAKTPASAAATGNAGDHCWDASYIYICTAANTWKRAAIATW
jgi:lysophospholipase L1-like esterase